MAYFHPLQIKFAIFLRKGSVWGKIPASRQTNILSVTRLSFPAFRLSFLVLFFFACHFVCNLVKCFSGCAFRACTPYLIFISLGIILKAFPRPDRGGFSFCIRPGLAKPASHSFIHSFSDSFNCNDNGLAFLAALHCCRFSGKCCAVKRLSTGQAFPQLSPHFPPATCLWGIGITISINSFMPIIHTFREEGAACIDSGFIRAMLLGLEFKNQL